VGFFMPNSRYFKECGSEKNFYKQELCLINKLGSIAWQLYNQ